MTRNRSIVFTDYALMKMHRRDIAEDEVRDILDDEQTQHRYRTDGRSEARRSTARRVLLVVYRREERALS